MPPTPPPPRTRSLRLAALLTPLLLALGLGPAGPARASDGVLEINQTCATQTGCFPGDAPGLPVTLPVAGSYRLTSNLRTSSHALTAILVSSDMGHPDKLPLRGRGAPGQTVGTTRCRAQERLCSHEVIESSTLLERHWGECGRMDVQSPRIRPLRRPEAPEK